MNTRSATSIFLIALLLSCTKNSEINVPAPPPPDPNEQTQQQEETPPDNTEPENEIPEDAILVTNPYMEKYLEEVHYPEGDFSYSLILNYPGGGPGEADIPPSVELTWPEGAAGPVSLHLCEGDGKWTRDYSLPEGTTSLSVSNLVPNQCYTYTVTDSDGKEVANESFYTKGHLHQIYFTKKVRNGRDLGGWTTYDGKKVAYRKLYRGGKPSDNYIDAAGREEALAVGIRAELILRTDTSSEEKNPPFGPDVDIYGPGFENGYSEMLKEGAKVKGCFEFVVNSLRQDKPVYFHCAIGSDRTGTMAIILLGALGVPEPDICKDYELSYFAPEDWSMTNGVCNRTRTYKSRYLDAINYLLKIGTGNFRDHVETYLLGIGVSKADITDFRNLMLE